MAINWSHLPTNVLNEVCLCNTRSPKYRRIYNKATGWHECMACGKKLAITSVLECDICHNPFVPFTYPEYRDADFLGAMCNACKC